MTYDFLAIGDTVSDAFITLEEASVHCDINSENCTISMRWGDKIPYKELTVVHGVGNSANAAVAAARLGMKSALVSNIGNDEYGKKIISHFKKERVDAKFVSMHRGIPTNYHFVLSYDAERTILVKHENYPYNFPARVPAPKTVYLSSLGSGTESYHEQIADFLEAHPDILLAFQPGTFQMKLGYDKLKRLYQRTNIFFANKQEFERILDTKESAIEVLLQKMKALGPTIPILTDGRNGAYALLENGEVVHVPMFPDPRPPVERTGAGDAFSSTTAAFMTLGMPLKDAMLRGTVNSAYVVQEIGAQKGLLSRAELEQKLTP